MPFSESDQGVIPPPSAPPFGFFIHVSSLQADDSSPRLASGCPGDNAVNAQDDRARKSSEGRSCEGDEEGHLVYHVGLVMKERCAYATPGSRPAFGPCGSVGLKLAATGAKLAASTTDFSFSHRSLACVKYVEIQCLGFVPHR